MAAARGGDGVGEANGGLGRLNQSDAGWTAFGVRWQFSAVLPVLGTGPVLRRHDRWGDLGDGVGVAVWWSEVGCHVGDTGAWWHDGGGGRQRGIVLVEGGEVELTLT